MAEEGVARKVATFEPNPLSPVETGRPLQFVRIPADGVPMSGVTRAGELDSTVEPVPVLVVVPVPPRATESVPVVPFTMGSPVQFVSVPEVGVPRTGVVSAVLVNRFVLVICLVAPPWTMTKRSGPVLLVAAGS